MAHDAEPFWRRAVRPGRPEEPVMSRRHPGPPVARRRVVALNLSMTKCQAPATQVGRIRTCLLRVRTSRRSSTAPSGKMCVRVGRGRRGRGEEAA